MFRRILRRAGALFIIFLLLIFTVYLYTFLHEGGHALVILLSGNAVTAFNLNFFDLSAHVEMTGQFSPAGAALNNLAGVALPLLLWAVFMAIAPRRCNPVMEMIKVIATILVLNTLLAWVFLPIIYMAGRPVNDDSINFLVNTGIHPIIVALSALILYAAGWVLFLKKIDGIRNEMDLFRKVDVDFVNPSAQKTLAGVIGVFAATGVLAFGLNGFTFSPDGAGAFRIPPEYQLVKTLDLSSAAYSQETIYSFTLDKPATVKIFLLLENIRADYLDIHLVGPDGFDLLLMHGEGFSANRNAPYFEQLLPEGEYRIQLTGSQTPGILSIFMDF